MLWRAGINCKTCLLAGLLFSSPLASQDEDYSEDVAQAMAAFEAWTAAYREGDYRQQWRLTDKHITRWWNRQQWREVMANARKRNGDLLSYTVKGAAEATAADLPCTEMGHCFRDGLDYVLIVIESEYGKARPRQPEFVVMAKSSDDWLFGGGTFLNRPMGETAVIMTEQDEQRYQPRVVGKTRDY